MIDIHCHILPGIDDGPADLAGSVEMARAAAEVGITRIVATPHLRGDFPKVKIDEVAGSLQRVAGRDRTGRHRARGRVRR